MLTAISCACAYYCRCRAFIHHGEVHTLRAIFVILLLVIIAKLMNIPLLLWATAPLENNYVAAFQANYIGVFTTECCLFAFHLLFYYKLSQGLKIRDRWIKYLPFLSGMLMLGATAQLVFRPEGRSDLMVFAWVRHVD